MRNLIIATIVAILFAAPAFAACLDPERPIGAVIYNPDFDVFQGCTARGWMAWHAPENGGGGGPTNCDNIGDTCSDGTIYAGISPDGNVRMYTTPADAPSLMPWNDGSSNWAYTPMENCTTYSPGAQASCRTGRANTDLLVGLGASPSPAPYVAANYCAGLSGAEGHGHDDWYLPAQDELNVLYVNLADDTITPGSSYGFDISELWPAGWYWSSSEVVDDFARAQRLGDGTQPYFGDKSNSLSVRCVRR